MQKTIFVLELKNDSFQQAGKAITLRTHLARSKPFPGISQRPASTVMNWYNTYWNGMQRPRGWLEGDSQEQFIKFSQGLKFFLVLKNVSIFTHRAKEDKEGRVHSLVTSMQFIVPGDFSADPVVALFLFFLT